MLQLVSLVDLYDINNKGSNISHMMESNVTCSDFHDYLHDAERLQFADRMFASVIYNGTWQLLSRPTKIYLQFATKVPLAHRGSLIVEDERDKTLTGIFCS